MSSETGANRSITWSLPAPLVEAMEEQAALEGLPTEQWATRVLEAGLGGQGLTRTGRCSVRTGLCSEGPNPLPLQQELDAIGPSP